MLSDISGLVLTSAIITVGTAHPTRKLKITWWKYVIFVGWAVPTFALEIFIYLQGIRPTQKVAFYTREKKIFQYKYFPSAKNTGLSAIDIAFKLSHPETNQGSLQDGTGAFAFSDKIDERKDMLLCGSYNMLKYIEKKKINKKN